jgi:phosphate transport system substrate-binding protein
MNKLNLSLAILSAALLVACGEKAPATADGTQASAAAPAAPAAQASVIQADGSSTVFPISEAIAEEFQKANAGTRVTVGLSGTGGGFKKFCRGEIDIANASRPIMKEEVEACAAAGIKFFELPVAYDALTVVANPANEFLSSISIPQLKQIWEPEAQGKIETWDQVDAKWPAEKINLYGAGSDSGTFDYFTEAVTGKAKSSRGDYTASEDDNVLVQGVLQDKFALGYFGFAYYVENQAQLKALPISPDGVAPGVAPSKEAVINGTYTPLARPLFVYVSEKAYARQEVKSFVEFMLTEGAKLVDEVNFISLPPEAYALAKKHVAEGRVGSVFDGRQEPGLSIEQLMTREAKM